MQFPKQAAIMTIAAFLSTAVRAAPAEPAPTNLSVPSDATLSSFCHNLSWENQVSDASPEWDDCDWLFRDLGTQHWANWDWTVTQKQNKIIDHRTCVIGGQRWEKGGSKVGADDLRGILRYSLDNYKYTYGDGIARVGSKGQMQCGDNLVADQVNWGLYHS
ncbi:hypothetical protein QBC43DRAFT_359167 [Cladorrhinum sp. PSN259]|nr:hypothetical protein QBC43DRAFT_359167 [Cladorrhinum sp. PSN259]